MNNNVYVHIMNQAIENVRIVMEEADAEALDLIQDQVDVLNDMLFVLTHEIDQDNLED